MARFPYKEFRYSEVRLYWILLIRINFIIGNLSSLIRCQSVFSHMIQVPGVKFSYEAGIILRVNLN